MATVRDLKDFQGNADAADDVTPPPTLTVRSSEGLQFTVLPVEFDDSDGEVREALNPKGQKCVVKIASASSDSKGFINEYEILKKMKFDATLVVTEQCSYLFMEYVPGKQLSYWGNSTGVLNHFIQGYFDGENAHDKIELLVALAKIILNIFSLIEDMHTKKIAHTDLNTANILWDLTTGKGRIIDFGNSICFDDCVDLASFKKKIKERYDESVISVEHFLSEDYRRICSGIVSVFDHYRTAENLKFSLEIFFEFYGSMQSLERLFNTMEIDSEINLARMVADAKNNLQKFINRYSLKQLHDTSSLPKEIVPESKAAAPVQSSQAAVLKVIGGTPGFDAAFAAEENTVHEKPAEVANTAAALPDHTVQVTPAPAASKHFCHSRAVS